MKGANGILFRKTRWVVPLIPPIIFNLIADNHHFHSMLWKNPWFDTFATMSFGDLASCIYGVWIEKIKHAEIFMFWQAYMIHNIIKFNQFAPFSPRFLKSWVLFFWNQPLKVCVMQLKLRFCSILQPPCTHTQGNVKIR